MRELGLIPVGHVVLVTVGSWKNDPYASRNIESSPDNMNMYSQINMLNTIAGLTNVIDNLQQEQINMHTRQHNWHTWSGLVGATGIKRWD